MKIWKKVETETNLTLYSSLKIFSAISVAQEPTNSSLTLQSGGNWASELCCLWSMISTIFDSKLMSCFCRTWWSTRINCIFFNSLKSTSSRVGIQSTFSWRQYFTSVRSATSSANYELALSKSVHFQLFHENNFL